MKIETHKLVLFLVVSFFSFTISTISTSAATSSPMGSDLIKLSTDPAIYQIQADGKKHLFVNSPTFWSYYAGTWSNLKRDGFDASIETISQDIFDSIDTGNNIVIKPGSRLIKFSNSPKVYVIFSDNKLKSFSEQKALEIYGGLWKNKLVSIQNGFESNYIKLEEDFLDSDNDGLSDENETDIYHSNPLISDSDGDSYGDGVEVLYGYNPLGSGALDQGFVVCRDNDINCLENRFKNCQLSKVKYIDNQFIWEEEILGKKDELCKIKIKVLSSSDSSLLGKESICYFKYFFQSKGENCEKDELLDIIDRSELVKKECKDIKDTDERNQCENDTVCIQDLNRGATLYSNCTSAIGKLGQPELCEKISDKQSQNLCLGVSAQKNQNISSCQKINSKELQNVCLITIAKATGNNSICNNLPEGFHQWCLDPKIKLGNIGTPYYYPSIEYKFDSNNEANDWTFSGTGGSVYVGNGHVNIVYNQSFTYFWKKFKIPANAAFVSFDYKFLRAATSTILTFYVNDGNDYINIEPVAPFNFQMTNTDNMDNNDDFFIEKYRNQEISLHFLLRDSACTDASCISVKPAEVVIDNFK